MLQIAMIANTYPEVVTWARYKLRNKIERMDLIRQIYTLKNGDVVHLCWDDNNDEEQNKFLSYEFDAMMIHPQCRASLIETIRRRQER